MGTNEISDAAAMQRAIELGERARVTCGGDPWVGCVVVAGGRVVGEGAHQVFGGPHAEPIALERAGDTARGATAYVTLEPCNHHGRTPPCTDALIEAGVARVVVALTDTDPRVRGSGLDRLRSAGVTVEVGVAAEKAEASLRAYLHQRSTGRPWTVLKLATSLDGRLAAADGTSQWITGEAARADAHRLRARSQAVVVGSGTARADRPRLTPRGVEGVGGADGRTGPLRVVLDARGRVAADGPLFDTATAPTLVVTTSSAPAERVSEWKDRGAEVAEVSAGRAGGVALGPALDLLGRRGIVQALVEGGAGIAAAMVRDDLVDELVVYVGPVILGGHGRAAFEGLDVPTLASAPRWELDDVARLGPDVRARYRRARSATGDGSA